MRPGKDAITLLRPGPITAEAISDATGLPVIGATAGTIEAPGQMTSHYAPGKPVTLNCTEAPVDSFHIRFEGYRCPRSGRGNRTGRASRCGAPPAQQARR